MTFKFLNIRKCNEELARVEGELKIANETLAKVQAELKTAQEQAKAGGDIEALTKSNEEAAAELQACKTQLADLEAKLKVAQAAVTEFDVKVQNAASAKALEIAAAQGIPPIGNRGSGDPKNANAKTEARGQDRFLQEFNAKNAHLFPAVRQS